ncbi:MAG: 3-deoxy-8-phosphooctulonate synthase [Pseudomonadota bacterium]|nr:3-deoxy-8-phosphooctulonate synthase [Pseudomonadota bacterium]
MREKVISLNKFQIGNKKPLVVICGPCQLESLEHTRMIAEEILGIFSSEDISFIFKASYDKANRTSIETSRGLGIEKGLTILDKIRKEFMCPILTDIHDASQCEEVAKVVDVIQIPAFLCRQTDLLLAAGKTGKIINIKKGQFLAPEDMKHAAKKIESTGNTKIMLCERGSTFGYNNLVNDFRSLPIMSETGYPVVFDSTHSVQLPGKGRNFSSGQSKYVPILAQAACAVGIAAVFLETHDNPKNAPSDGPNMIPLNKLRPLISKLRKIDHIVKNF